MTERERMEAGLWYDANHNPEVHALRKRADELCHRLNVVLGPRDEERDTVMRELIPDLGKDCEILSPLYVDNGAYCHIGARVFVNHGAYLMDGGGITIGDNCFIGPNLGAYTAAHPLLPEQRNTGLEKASPIIIGPDCWLGANVTIMPGVTIGEGCVIGACSLVTKDIPAHSLAMGSPCRVVRAITEADRIER
jgi:acetyltransferase-like isoleucine patch superfamily enzyme